MRTFSKSLSSFQTEHHSFTCLTTREIVSSPESFQEKLKKEIEHFFPVIFKSKEDWEYMVRHFFYLPEGNTIRQTIFARDSQGSLVGLCAFDNGVFLVDGQKINIIYIHIRAVLPSCREYGMGRTFSSKILKSLNPDLLLTTCVQLSSLYSWIRISDPVILDDYLFFPRVEGNSNSESIVRLPLEELDFIIRCFKMIYISHVKEDKKRLDDVVSNITVNMVRKGVEAKFDQLKWQENNKISLIAENLGITEQDSILLVIRRKKQLFDLQIKNQTSFLVKEKIQCCKYHSFGNSFIILDETKELKVNEDQKSMFAKQVLDGNTGIGADGLIVLSSPEIAQINLESSFQHLINTCDYIFRHFEPDGTESFMCLNGLIVTALYASKTFGKKLFNVLSATNYKMPQLLKAGIDENEHAFVEEIVTSSVDQTLVAPGIVKSCLPGLGRIESLELQLRQEDLVGFEDMDPVIDISGYFTFSGEPHLVIFADRMIQGKHFTDLLFQRPSSNRRRSLGDRFIETIGMRMQNGFNHLFPKGLNITFANVINNAEKSTTTVWYRCFERAINKETLSCGTAALACASVSLALGFVKFENAVISPYLFNRNKSGAFYRVIQQSAGINSWKICGKPEQIGKCFYG